MAIKKLLYYPDPKLKQISSPVETLEEAVRIVNDLRDTLAFKTGIGLSAPQIDVFKQVFILNYAGCPQVVINPVVTSMSKATDKVKEACLSVPGHSDFVERSLSITLEYRDIDWGFHKETFHDTPARCLQHELDHLNGIVYPDKLGNIKRTRALAAVGKFFRS